VTIIALRRSTAEIIMGILRSQSVFGCSRGFRQASG
jgi:hypothetical protein